MKRFCNFQGTNAYNFAKKTQNLKTRAYFKQNFIELDMKKISDPKALTFEVWGLWTSLGQFGPKAFCKGFIKPLRENPSFNFQKQDFIFSGIMRWIKWNPEISKDLLTLGMGSKNKIWAIWAWKTCSQKSRTLAPVFTNKTSFSQDLWDKSNKFMKTKNICWLWGLGLETTFGSPEPRRHIQA